MNQKTRSIFFAISGLLVLAGAALYLTRLSWAPYLFAFGSAGVALSHLTIPVTNLNFRQKRLHKFNVLAGLLMIVSSGLMFNNRNEWILLLSIAAMLQLYSSFVSPKE